MERFELPGYVVEELIGFGGTGQVWRAKEADTGETVALKRLKARGVLAADRLRREAGMLAAAAGPHVIGVRRLLVDDDEAVMVLDYAAGGSFADVLATRGRLPTPEVVTVIAPISAALAAAHSRDLVHGDLTPANILFTDEGRPLLADFGVARAVGATSEAVEATVDYVDPMVAAGAQPSSASDVFALGAVAFHALTGHPPWGTGTREEVTRRAASGHRPSLADVAPDLPDAVVDAVETMLATDPLDRPDARTAGNSLLRASAVAPVGLNRVPTPLAPPPPTELVRPQPRSAVFDEPDDEDDLPEWTPWRRRVVVAGAAGLAVVGAIGVGVSLAGSGHPSQPPAAGPPAAVPTAVPVAAPTTNWKAVVAHLDALRAAAFAEDDVAALADVYAPGASAYDEDVATLKSLAGRGVHAQGFTAHVDSVHVLAATPGSERLRVVDRLSGYQLVDDAGAVVGHGAARPARAFTMQLTKVDGTWRVASISLD